MDIRLIFVSIALAGVLIGTIFDLKARWVPDYVNYFMIFFGLAGHAIISIQANSIWPFAYSLIAVGILYVLSAVLFYAGAWGGGDAKMLIGLGALLASPGRGQLSRSVARIYLSGQLNLPAGRGVTDALALVREVSTHSVPDSRQPT